MVARGGRASTTQTRKGKPYWSPPSPSRSVRGRGAKRTQGMPQPRLQPVAALHSDSPCHSERSAALNPVILNAAQPSTLSF